MVLLWVIWVLLAVLLIVMVILPPNSSPDYYFFVRLSFLVAGIFFFVFAAPLFLFIEEPKERKCNEEGSYKEWC